ncbi:MAG: phenylalanine--tRNA ligase subunit beta [Magnetococcales bacterium]|nr:phenylalanine--tRNA ligase subunit beta [Magnetococcales bacterium]
MKFTHQWLLDHLDTSLSPVELGERLTMAGLELESLVDRATGLDKVQVGALIDVGKHPDADRLTVCKVRVGTENLTIVCGAKNHKKGDKVAVARVGAQLPNGMKIKRGKIRGQVSEGMLCSTAELGITESAEGILILPPETEEGIGIIEALSLNDHTFEVDLTPNRGDCLGVRGIARDLGAILDVPVKSMHTEVAVDPTVAERYPVEIRIDDGEGCPRYSGRVIEGVKIGPSPEWLVQRLEAVGLRSINNVVDITNYILLDLNQPLHAFDLDTLNLPIIVRCATENEKITLLDEQEYTLTPEMTLISDTKRPLALAGIMGGLQSGVTDSTVNILLESAYFDPIRVTRAGRRLNLLSDSRFRFERGTDPEGITTAIDRATNLLIEVAGGTAGPIILIDAGTWNKPKPLPFDPDLIRQRGGVDLSNDQMIGMLQRLGCEQLDDGRFQPPSHRHDLRLQEDLLEEVVRVYGYDRVKTVLPTVTVSAPAPDPITERGISCRRIFTGYGYFEVVNYAFIDPSLQKQFDPDITPLTLMNPISEEQSVMRTKLVCGLVETAQRNLSRGNNQLNLFEIGHVFLKQPDNTIQEEERLGGLISGPIGPRAWHSAQIDVDFFDLKGDLQGLFAALRTPGIRFATGGPDFLHPGRKAEIFSPRPGAPMGWIGQLHPAIQEKMGLSQPAYIFELNMEGLRNQAKTNPNAPMISPFPAVERDFAFVVAESVTAQEIITTIRKVSPKLIQHVVLFDVYTGDNLDQGKKSLAIGVFLQSESKTLSEEDVQPVAEKIISRVTSQFDAQLRGG